MEDYRTILRKEEKWDFRTLNFEDKPYGEVEPSFNREFCDELGSSWVLIDKNGNKHTVGFNKSKDNPLITNGWSNLRSFYRMTGTHSVHLRYLEDFIFEITVFKTPTNPGAFPRWHSMYPYPKNFGSFKMTLTQYQATGSQLNLPMDFQNSLRDSGFDRIALYGPEGIQGLCDILVRAEPKKSVKIGNGLKKFAADNHFKKGDKLDFQI